MRKEFPCEMVLFYSVVASWVKCITTTYQHIFQIYQKFRIYFIQFVTCVLLHWIFSNTRNFSIYVKTLFKSKKNKHSKFWIDCKWCIWNRRGNKYARLILISYCIGDQTVDRDLPVDRDKLVGWSRPLFCLHKKFIYLPSSINISSFDRIFWTNIPLRMESSVKLV